MLLTLKSKVSFEISPKVAPQLQLLAKGEGSTEGNYLVPGTKAYLGYVYNLRPFNHLHWCHEGIWTTS